MVPCVNGQMFGAERGKVCLKQTKHTPSRFVYLVDAVTADQFDLHVSLSHILWQN